MKSDGVLGSTFGAGQFQIIMGKNLSATFTQVVKIIILK